MKLRNKLLAATIPAVAATAIPMVLTTSCGTLTTQLRFGNSKSQLCGYHPCTKTGYESYYATTKIEIVLVDDEAVTIKASDISITCKGTEFKCKGFATLGTTVETQSNIESIASEFKFTAKNYVAQYVMFDDDMYTTYSGCTDATAKIKGTNITKFYDYCDIKISI